MTEAPEPICRLDEIPAPGSAGFRRGDLDFFVVQVGEAVAAYENHCPHVGSPLDWVPGRFLDFERQNILCATHGARFRVADGTCFEGPCVGKALTPVPIRIEAGIVYLAHEAPQN